MAWLGIGLETPLWYSKRSTELTRFAVNTHMPPKRAGQHFDCPYCGDQFYRRPSHVRRGITKTCGKRRCISASAMGANNAFWGKNHSEHTREHLKVMRKSRPPRPPGAAKYGPLKGTYKASAEAREKLSAAMRADWAKNRDKRLAACAKASETHQMKRLSDGPRYRVQFTPMQRRDWADAACKWCDATEDLVLDHILPVMAGGTNRKSNAQTLCRRCNLWKVRYVDRPLLLAMLDAKGANYNPEYQEQTVTFADSSATDLAEQGGETSSDLPLWFDKEAS